MSLESVLGHRVGWPLGPNAIGGTAFASITDPGALPITGLLATVGNAPGTLVPSGGGSLGGSLPLAGAVRVCLFGQGACDSPAANLSVPLTPIGSGGHATVAAVVNLTVFGAPWTSGTAAIGSITRMGSAMGPASATGSTAQVGGRLQLVTPISITTNIGASVVLPAFAILTLHFVPEPAERGDAGCRRRVPGVERRAANASLRRRRRPQARSLGAAAITQFLPAPLAR